MNRKIQDSDALFIVARYKRDWHTFSARGEAAKYKVSVVTIYNVLSKAGVKMRRGRKPTLAPPAPLISPESTDAHRVAPGDLTREPPPVPTKPYPDPYAQFTPKPPLTPKPPITPRKGPPVIRPNAR